MFEGKDDTTDCLDAAVSERSRLLAIAYRLLGSMAEAEDAIQETYIRYYRMEAEQRAAIGNVQGWLTRVASNVCFDILKSARFRREQYVGPWLPEPLPLHMTGVIDPADRVTLDESVSTALLMVLETLTPPERVAFVLHDVFGMPFAEIANIVGRTPAGLRQLANRARHRVQASRTEAAPAGVHNDLVRTFATACEEGDLGSLVAVLDPSIVLISDGGGFVRAAPNPIYGAVNVARFLLGVLAKRPSWHLHLRRTTDGLAVAVVQDHNVAGLASLRCADGKVKDVWLVLNPHKLSHWN